MQLTTFETVIIAERANGDLLVALFDGAAHGVASECVALLTCPVEAGRALCKALGSALKEAEEQQRTGT